MAKIPYNHTNMAKTHKNTQIYKRRQKHLSHNALYPQNDDNTSYCTKHIPIICQLIQEQRIYEETATFTTLTNIRENKERQKENTY